MVTIDAYMGWLSRFQSRLGVSRCKWPAGGDLDARVREPMAERLKRILHYCVENGWLDGRMEEQLDKLRHRRYDTQLDMYIQADLFMILMTLLLGRSFGNNAGN